MDIAARSRANTFHCKSQSFLFSRVSHVGFTDLPPHRLAGVAFAMALLEENHPVLIDDLTNRSRIAGEV
ncbi:hypothetical protein LJR034_006378 [Caballeronia sp. LjRoot34]|uniref:hypothetical protein n=1 Tax=Caballeronia sp. LjRoot34 TaxID=3342325 RepID=UPI003ECCDBD2